MRQRCTSVSQPCYCPLAVSRECAGSVDGHTLSIKELKGEEIIESINLSDKRLGVASAVIIASLITSNTVTTSLKCVGLHPSHL